MKKLLVALATVVCAFTINAQESNTMVSKTDTNTSCQNKTSNCCFKQSPHHFTMSLGYGFCLSDKHDVILANYNASETHRSSMRHGVDYRFDYDYNFHNNFAAGLVFNMYNSFDSYYAGDEEIGTNSDDRWLFYVGPSFTAHTNMVKDHYIFFAKATVGYLNFRNAQRSLSADGSQILSTTYSRGTFGYGLSAGVSYYINKYISLDCSLGYMGGEVSKLKTAQETFDLEENENLSRLNINVGVKIKL